MCRGCFFVQMDSDGVDIDGCWKADILEDIRCESGHKIKAIAILDEEEKKLQNEDSCFQGLSEKEMKVPLYCPQLQSQRTYMVARNLAIHKWENDLRQKIKKCDV